VKLKEYAEDPLKHARKLIDPRIGTYRFRIGEYRAIFDIDGENIVILRIGHRKSKMTKGKSRAILSGTSSGICHSRYQDRRSSVISHGKIYQYQG